MLPKLATETLDSFPKKKFPPNLTSISSLSLKLVFQKISLACWQHIVKGINSQQARTIVEREGRKLLK